MKERGILFSAPMVRALLAGTKTQTRRPIKNPHRRDDGFVLVDHGDGWWPYRSHDGESSMYLERKKDGDYYNEAPLDCPYGQPGDRLWVRETWGFNPDFPGLPAHACYRADPGHDHDGIHWKPSIHMPRAASRTTLEITEVRLERLQDVSAADCISEGVGFDVRYGGHCVGDGAHFHASDPRESYFSLWEAINGPGSVDANPWVWVLSFRRAA